MMFFILKVNCSRLIILLGLMERNLYGKLAEFYQEHADDSRVFWMDKRHYSAFSGTDLDIRLRERR